MFQKAVFKNTYRRLKIATLLFLGNFKCSIYVLVKLRNPAVLGSFIATEKV